MGKYLGNTGLSYLWGKIKTLVGQKQDVISDLEEIRSGAALGATSLQSSDAQIQSDWEQTTTTAKDYIKNKPTIPTITFRQW